MKFGILGSGSWGTALAKILTDNGQSIYWWNRSETAIQQFRNRHHNPQYLPSAKFDIKQLTLTTCPNDVVKNSDVIVIAVPSAYALDALDQLDKNILAGKKIVSAIKGIIPQNNLLLNDYLKDAFNIPLEDYFAVLGPCHAEEVAAEKLSYLTFTGVNEVLTEQIAAYFKTDYLNTVLNKDIYGVQYAAVLKNIYAVGAGIAHGLDYGDNFLSVLIANSADEMAGFLRKAGIINAEVGYIDHSAAKNQLHNNYAASVYLGDLLVTCYSLHSRNRAFGNMIGKGYSVKAAQLEMSMVAEGYTASKCMEHINKKIGADMPIANAVFNILWNNSPAKESFAAIEEIMI
ncbi:NAD(P)H-dependent glycerol-3-phosphate dehydrogenase [Ferruginibacter sp. HRS2-29]|uniref:NAD(P)H-dependent glycerol-3-phosphate dehydrogenase n=1 Tax=Ferruginibacter sp. HRS2-29 TaxID=2487334 RepID=UPI0020CCF476|nr:NAD(P)H-dependent glycerol-3-phosphate dehydrogenase [Ferruginibacter sp. HRS2-29]MCP9751734.1 glycerol-3-phosphate dehydrogenase [Ferruginibacter sp. HRS2-29]